jgi:hypothetical protein
MPWYKLGKNPSGHSIQTGSAQVIIPKGSEKLMEEL